jgi:dTMP kinase
MKTKGVLITFEGIDGSGKTTQLQITEQYLRQLGYDILVLREPGSTPISEEIRKILLHTKGKIDPASELLLYLAARTELVKTIITPALEKGRIVLCDRYYDSTTAYQGYGRGLDIKLINQLNRFAVGKAIPFVTFLVDIDYKTSLTRRKKVMDRLESEPMAFFNRVRHGFLEIARKNKGRVIVLDGRQAANKIFYEVVNCLKKKLRIK